LPEVLFWITENFQGVPLVSIVRVGLAETKKFAEGYDAIFSKKKEKSEKGKKSKAAGKSASSKKKKPARKKK
jgi:hypothetical protein